MTDIEQLFDPIRKFLSGAMRDHDELLGRFDRLVASHNHLEHNLGRSERDKQARGDAEDENEELRERLAAYRELSIGVLESTPGKGDRVKARTALKMFVEGDMRTEAWLKMNYIERWEYERAVDDHATELALVKEEMEKLWGWLNRDQQAGYISTHGDPQERAQAPVSTGKEQA